MKEFDRWGAMVAFVAVADRLSYAAAAAALGLSTSAVSRRVSQLEERLGCRLLSRTTRDVALTEAGDLYLDRCRQVLELAAEADAEASSHSLIAQGVLRVGLPNFYGQTRIAPLLPEFLALYPGVRLELNFDDRFADLIDRRLDVSIRIGGRFEGEFIVRRLADNPRRICASPDYLARRGVPREPRDLVDHDTLHFSPLVETGRWRLSRDGQVVQAAIRPRMIADNIEALRRAAVAGQGLTILADFVAADDLAAGRLVTVMDDWKAAESHVYAIYPAVRHLPLKVRVFIDFLAERLDR